MDTKLRVGVSRQVISPPPGIYQIGYGDRSRGNEGIHDDLTATALVFDDGQQRVAIVACDLLAINEITAARAQSKLDLPVLISCSHTHSGPIAYADDRSPKRNRAYVDLLVERLVQSVRGAVASLQPAVLHGCQGEARIATNRRERQADGRIEIGVNPTGPVDRSLGVLQARTASGDPLATLVNFACHGTVLGPDNLLVSADWPGAMRRVVEAATGAPALFIQGATGDMNPVMNTTRSDWDAVRQLGERVGEAVIECLPRLETFEGAPVRYAQANAWLPLQAEATTTQPPPLYRKILAKEAGVPSLLVDTVLNRRYPWKAAIEARGGRWAAAMNIQAARLGDLIYAGYGMEVFTEIGMAVKSCSPAARTMFASLTTGCVGYLPTREEHARGGYEVELAPYFYRLPGILDPGAAEIALEETRRLMGEIWS